MTGERALKQLTLHPAVTGVAEKLAGVPVRPWCDQPLVKQAHNTRPTYFHRTAIRTDHMHTWATCPPTGLALVDVPAERDWVTVIPGSHTWAELRVQNIEDSGSLMSMCSDLVRDQRSTTIGGSTW